MQNSIKQNEKGELSISAYSDGLAEKKEIATGIAKLCAAFPKMEQGFWSILTERIVVNNFTKKRMRDAVGYVLDNFRYKELNISDIIQFDKRIKLYSYYDVYRMTGQVPHPDFEKREINGNSFYVKKTDLLNNK
ncbi:MAG: hypothetical protein FWF52_00475 [Candidatus Azobacteroides sp.]|nr:hypothetical protein [Candidatus Azobacteroides sp.]